MQIYLSHASLPSLGIAELLDKALESGFDGIAISDRDPQIWDPVAIDRLRSRAKPSAFGCVVDANADLTLSDPEARTLELRHLQRLLQVCERLSADVMRIAIGGQKVSVRKILSRRRSNESGSSDSLLRRVLASRIGIRLGHLLRIRQRGRPFPNRETLEIASESLATLAPMAMEVGVRLAVENHWGVTTWPQDLVEIVEGAGSGVVGTCPDFENFPAGVDRYQALEILAPLAVIAHARSSRFSSAGEERSVDYSRCMGILARAGFDGALCVEFLGAGDPLLGAVRTRNLIRNCLEGTAGRKQELGKYSL